MPLFYDQMNRSVKIQGTPQRIISSVPSQTELLFDLGLNDRIIGITKFCTHPADQIKQVVKVGGTKQLNLGLIHSLNPDLIIANKEENDESQIKELMQHYPVWVSDVNDLGSAIEMISHIGAITDTADKAAKLAKDITQSFDSLAMPGHSLTCAYLIWRKPYMAVGTGTFINDMLLRCGLNNLVVTERYPVLTEGDLQALNPDVLLLSSEPYPFTNKHITGFKALLPNARIILVDGEIFSWYGSRLLQSPGYFKALMKKLLPNNEADTEN